MKNINFNWSVSEPSFRFKVDGFELEVDVTGEGIEARRIFKWKIWRDKFSGEK